MRAIDLLFLLVSNYRYLAFTTKDASDTLIGYQVRNPKAYLVDNPNGLLPKWVSNDLKRLHAMNFLDRRYEKRPISKTPGSNRGFQYLYWANNAGLGYYNHLLRIGFRIAEKPAYYSEVDIFKETASVRESDRAIVRQEKRIKLGWVKPVDPRMSYSKKLKALEEGDRNFRRGAGLFRRYAQGRKIADLTNQINSLTQEKKMLETSLVYLNARYEKCRSELKFYRI